MAEVAGSAIPARLRMRDIRKQFGGTIALDGVDFSVAAGEIHALVGENGAGKSTLMKVLSGAVHPDSGNMEIDGLPFHPRDTHEARRAGIAMIYQELSLADHLTVEENVTLGMEPARFGLVNHREVRRLTERALAQLGHSDISPDLPVRSLSIAARQVVEIARALAIGCKVLVLDEPTSSLSLEDVKQLFAVLELLRNQGHAIVYISHFLEEVKQVAGSFTVLRDGRSVGGGATASIPVGEIVRLMVGRQIDQLYPRGTRKVGEVLLDVKQLAGIGKPHSAGFELHRGEIFGIAGLVGAGRTELVRALFGLAPVRSGSVKLMSWAGPATPVERWRQGAGLLSEDRGNEGLATSLSITDNITMNLRKQAGVLGLIAPARQEAATRKLIERLDIRCIGPRQEVRALSGGNQQKVAFARLLHEDVDVLLLDEPTRGIDVASKSQIYELLGRLASGDVSEGIKPKAILIVSSYFPELLGICDRIAVMCRGVLGPARPANEWDSHSLMYEATGQGAAI